MLRERFGLIVLVGIVAVASGAAAQQTVSVDAKGASVGEPDELPGVYTVSFVVETDPQGPTCACMETEVWLSAEAGSALDVWRIEPTHHEIEWADHTEEHAPQDADPSHVQEVTVPIEASEDLAEDGEEVTITPEAWNRGLTPQAQTQTDGVTVVLQPRQTEGSSGKGSSDEASTAQAGWPWLGLGGLVPATLALAVPVARSEERAIVRR